MRQNMLVYRSHGGYTPLHIAAQHGHQEAFDLLVQVFKADANIRLALTRDEDPDPVIFGPPNPDPVLFSADPDPTCNN